MTYKIPGKLDSMNSMAFHLHLSIYSQTIYSHSFKITYIIDFKICPLDQGAYLTLKTT